MQLQEILAQHDFGLAGPEHDSELQEIFEQIPMRVGSILFSIQRQPSYFSFTNLRSDHNFTFYTRDSVTNRIASVGCLSIRRGYINGAPVATGFFGDMRSHFSRETSKKWRKFYGDLIKHAPECPELEHCQHFYTTILQPNRRAVQAYVRQGRNPFRYDPLPDCEIINIYGRMRPKLAHESQDHWRIRTATPLDEPAICEFLNEQNRKRVFGYCFEEELPRRVRSWNGFNLSRFFIVEDLNGRIAALTAPWSPGEAQQIILEGLPSSARIASWFTGRLHLKRWVRLPTEGSPVETLYLTHFHVADELEVNEKSQVASLLLDSIYDFYRDDEWNIMSFPIFQREQLRQALQGYLYHRIPLKVYSVHTPNGDLKQGAGDLDAALPGIEISLI